MKEGKGEARGRKSIPPLSVGYLSFPASSGLTELIRPLMKDRAYDERLQRGAGRLLLRSAAILSYSHHAPEQARPLIYQDYRRILGGRHDAIYPLSTAPFIENVTYPDPMTRELVAQTVMDLRFRLPAKDGEQLCSVVHPHQATLSEEQRQAAMTLHFPMATVDMAHDLMHGRIQLKHSIARINAGLGAAASNLARGSLLYIERKPVLSVASLDRSA